MTAPLRPIKPVRFPAEFTRGAGNVMPQPVAAQRSPSPGKVAPPPIYIMGVDYQTRTGTLAPLTSGTDTSWQTSILFPNWHNVTPDIGDNLVPIISLVNFTIQAATAPGLALTGFQMQTSAQAIGSNVKTAMQGPPWGPGFTYGGWSVNCTFSLHATEVTSNAQISVTLCGVLYDLVATSPTFDKNAQVILGSQGIVLQSIGRRPL